MQKNTHSSLISVCDRLPKQYHDVNRVDLARLMIESGRNSKYYNLRDLKLKPRLDITSRDPEGNTPLLNCCNEHSSPFIQMLLDIGASVTEQNNKGISALMKLVDLGQWGIIQKQISTSDLDLNFMGLTSFTGKNYLHHIAEEMCAGIEQALSSGLYMDLSNIHTIRTISALTDRVEPSDHDIKQDILKTLVQDNAFVAGKGHVNPEMWSRDKYKIKLDRSHVLWGYDDLGAAKDHLQVRKYHEKKLKKKRKIMETKK